MSECARIGPMTCEDYPCCGHTTLDPCERQWYDEPGAFDTSIRGNEHALCDHENGLCDVWEDDEECDGQSADCPHGGCENCDDDPDKDDFDWIRYDQQAELDQMEYNMGIEPSGWQDTVFPNEY